jgi:hypothetical protein
MIELKALSNIKHNGEEIKPDYTFSCDDTSAKALIEAGVAVEASARDLKVAVALRQADAEEAAEVGQVNNAPTDDTAAKLNRPETSLGNPASPTSTVNDTESNASVKDTDPEQPSLEWSRSQLESRADELGIDGVAQFPNKQAVLDAIVAKEAESDD